MDIYLHEFNKKFTVKQSNKNMKLTYKLQLKMAQVDDAEGKSPVEQVQLMLELTDRITEYITAILKLTTKQQAVLEDLENDATFALSNHITQRMLGMTEQEIKDSQNSEEIDPKK